MDARRAWRRRALARIPLRRWPIPALIALALLAAPSTGLAEDTDQIRFYGSFRLGIGDFLDTKQKDGLEIEHEALLTGMSVGVNLGRYLGAELAGDVFNTDLGLSIHASDTTMVGALGAGIEYFIADNIALGVEARYLISRDQEIEIGHRTQKAKLDALLAAVSLRRLFPESPAAHQTEPADYRSDGRFYLGLRLGGETQVHDRVAEDVEARPPHNAIGGTLGPFYGVVLGMDLTRYLGVEVAGEGFEFLLAVPHQGSVAKYGVYAVTSLLRLRYPVLGGRLVPYVLGGAGVTWGEVHDIKPQDLDLDISGQNYAPVGAVGIGTDYFVAHNIAVGLERKYLISRGHTVTIAGRTQDMNLDSLLTFLGVRIYFGKGSAS